MQRRNVLAGSGLLAITAAAVSWWALASEPASHDVAVPTQVGQTVTVEWTGVVPAGAPGAATNSCGLAPDTGTTDDHHLVNLSVADGTYDRVNVSATFSIEWEQTNATPLVNTPDLVLTVTQDGTELGSADGSEPREAVVVSNPTAGVFDAIACAYVADADTPYRGKLVLTATAAGGGGGGGGGDALSPPAGTGNASGLPPRFQPYAPDYPKLGFGMFGGEATLDVNWKTGSIFYLGFLETLRLRLDHSTSPAIQTWEKMATVASSKVTSDPILVGDRDTGRIFAMQLLLGPGTSAMDYTDDDGESFTPGMAGTLLRSGADHQAMDVGPYPPDTNIPHPLYPNAVYYCSQDIALAYCSRSDDGGVTFGPSTPIYTQGNCNGLHGHVKVARDGVVYVPNSKCTELGGGVGILANRNAVIVSEDAGLTWEVRFVGETLSGGGSDPSIGSADDGTVYLAYTDENLRLHMTRSDDHGQTWVNDVNIGELAGITGAEFPAVVAGDADRAAVAFFGTTYRGEGDPEDAAGFPGEWHLYLATTYDGGQTYHVVNLTPNDPIQRGPICGGNYCRNLLDFFDAAIDPEGRVLVAYEDGCVGGCVTGGVSQYSDQAIIAMQSGGRRLYAAHDPVEPAKAGAPRIEGYRKRDYAYLEWPAPDSGGSAVSEYRVYRAAGTGPMSLLRSAGKQQRFLDTGLDDATTYRYRVTAVNGQGESAMGNELSLAKDANAPTPELGCGLPGDRVAIDLTGESEAAPLTRDISEIYVAEPEDLPGKLVVSLRAAQSAPQQAGGKFFVYFDTSTQKDRTWRASIGPEGMTLDYWDGTVELTDDMMDWQRVYTAAGNLEEGSGITADGFVRFVFDKAKLGLANKGDRLLAVNGRSFPSVRGSNILTEEAGYIDHLLRGNDFCALGGFDPPPSIGPGSGPVVGVVRDQGRFGGALGAGLLAGLAALAGLRMRQRSRRA